MAYVQKEESTISRRGLTLADRVKDMERRQRITERGEETEQKTKEWKFPFKWRWKFRQSLRKSKTDMMLVLFLNKKNEIEPPKFMPIFDGNMIVWKNKPYEFDPRAVWTVKGIRKNPKAYLIKEIDRRPVMNRKGKVVYRDAAVSNMDLDEIRQRGDSTESDEFLIKAALKAQTSQIPKSVGMGIIVLIILAAVGGLLWFMFGG